MAAILKSRSERDETGEGDAPREWPQTFQSDAIKKLLAHGVRVPV